MNSRTSKYIPSPCASMLVPTTPKTRRVFSRARDPKFLGISQLHARASTRARYFLHSQTSVMLTMFKFGGFCPKGGDPKLLDRGSQGGESGENSNQLFLMCGARCRSKREQPDLEIHTFSLRQHAGAHDTQNSVRIKKYDFATQS